MLNLTAKPLNPDEFAPYGEVIDVEIANSFKINYGLTTRFHDMATIDVSDNGGKSGFSMFEAQAAKLPHAVKVMEYHPLGSQLFYPVGDIPFLVLVAPAAETLDVDKLVLFVTNGKQGVNFHKGTWHHYLLPIVEDGSSSQFIVVDRIGEDKNCIEAELDGSISIQL